MFQKVVCEQLLAAKIVMDTIFGNPGLAFNLRVNLLETNSSVSHVLFGDNFGKSKQAYKLAPFLIMLKNPNDIYFVMDNRSLSI